MARHRRPEPELADPRRFRCDTPTWRRPEPTETVDAGRTIESVAPTPPVLDSDARLDAENRESPEEQAETDVPAPLRSAGAHRRTSAGASGRVLAVSVAAGALFAATTSSAHAASVHPAAVEEFETAPEPSTPPESLSQAPQVLQVAQVPTLADFADQLDRARLREERRLAREAEARRPKTLMPVSGTLTSSVGPRWGTTHYGLDIANTIGTPIVSVTDGTVLEAGPASGFGLWVRVLQDDGTIGVYGHIDQALVSAGQRVRAGEQIATVGNRGQSTGPHLHYEVWEPDGRKGDPMAWLSARGVQVAPDARA
ncbi:M23 family metallopeptidase [Rhodococcus sp. NPDC060090]|uniref:M23 family metallopeptidase n=1 Tax=Rhodococcus sp. NPDC060090 TaxID=3347056 RepID=UPI0036466669